MISTSRVVPDKTGSRRRRRAVGGRKGRRGGPDVPANDRYDIAEVFSMDDEEYTETDFLIDHVLRRGSIKGRRL